MSKSSNVIFDGREARNALEADLYEAGAQFDGMGFDSYDNSIELYEVPRDYRMDETVQRILFDAGFSIAYVNHEDKWETHYRWDVGQDFKVSKGWRVSYPQKRGEGEKGIWVEKPIDSWPKEWFDTGYAVVKRP